MGFCAFCFLMFMSDFLLTWYICFLVHNFVTRFRNEISRFFLAVMRCPSEVSRVVLHTFHMRFGAFWPF